VPAEKVVALEEVVVDTIVEGRGDDKQVIKRTRIKLRSARMVIQACELLGRYLSIWKDRAALTDAVGAGPAVIEVRWKGAPQDAISSNGNGSPPATPTAASEDQG
jgi:hypothetical protein